MDVRLFRVAPLVVLRHGQWQIRVEHGVEYVDERHFGDGGAKQLRPLIEHRADQQAAGAAAADCQLRCSGEALGDQVFGAGDKVAEGVVLVLLLAGAIPGFPQFAAATHVGNGKRHAAIQQTQARVGKPRVEAFAIGTIAVEVQRHGFAQVCALDHQADGHLRAVRRRGPQALADVGVGIERAEHRGLLEDFLLAGRQFKLADLRRTVQRFVAQANPVAFELQAVLYVQAIGCVWQLHAIRRQALRVNFNDRQAANPQAQGHGPGVQADAVDHHRVAVGDQVLPVGFGGRGAGIDGRVQGEIDAVTVAANEPGPLTVEYAVVDVVLMLLDPWRDAGKGVLRLVGVKHPGFAGGLAAHGQQQLLLGA
ncbi:hypothetical protein D3C84_634300 [compost metagenome]